jgi:HEAT repeat protein
VPSRTLALARRARATLPTPPEDTMKNAPFLTVGLVAAPVLVTAALFLLMRTGTQEERPPAEPLARASEPPGASPRLEGSGPGPALPASPAGPGAGGAGLAGSRVPSGVDLSDPAQVQSLLDERLKEKPIDWAAVAYLLERTPAPLDPSLRDFLLVSLRTGDRVGALQAIGQVRDPALADGLFAILDDQGSATAVRQAALMALAALPGGDRPAIVRGIEARLTGDVRQDVLMLQAISNLGGREAARAIVDYMRQIEDTQQMPNLQFLRLDVVGDAGAAEVIRDAIRSAASDAALTSLVRMAAHPGAEAFTAALIALDTNDRSPAVRREAVQGLGRLGTAGSVDYLLQIAHEQTPSGTEARRAIGQMGGATPEAKERLVDALQGERSREMRVELLRALGNLEYVGAREPMARMLREGDPAIVSGAVRGLGRIGEAAQPHARELVDLWASGDESLRRDVAVALGGIGGPEARRALEQMAATEGLSDSLGGTVRMALKRLTRDEQDREREAAGASGATLVGPGGRR